MYVAKGLITKTSLHEAVGDLSVHWILAAVIVWVYVHDHSSSNRVYGYYFILLKPMLHQSQTMTIRLHEHDAGIAILTSGMTDLSGFRAVAHPDR